MRRLPATWIEIPVLLLFFLLALSSLTGDSPTMDEQNHIARGLAFLRTGDPRLNLEHPPLVNNLSALPLLTLPDVRLPTDDPSWQQREGWYRFAELLLWEYNHDVTRMLFLARLPIVFLTMGLGLVAFHFAQALWGRPAGLLAPALLLLDPNIIAHGRYSTTDIGGTTFLLLATALLWRSWTCAGNCRQRTLLAGIGLGLAFGSKLSTLVFVPIYAVLAVLPLYESTWRPRAALRRLGQLLIAGLVSLTVLWAIFGFQWGPLAFRSAEGAISSDAPEALTSLLETLDGMHAPIPTFWSGIEQILLLSGGGRPTFLLGTTSTEGFLAYFPVAFLAKTPLPTLLLLLFSLVLLFRRIQGSRRRQRALFLLIPALLYFLVSMQSALNIGYRHLLLILPLLYLLIAGGLATLWQDQPLRGARAVAAILLLGLLAATLSIHPYYLSYFNQLAGGPENGYEILIDSNVDWGQDLLRLKRWMVDNDVDEVYLSWFGSADPSYYGIDYKPLPGLPRHFQLWWNLPFDPAQPPPGVYAISASNLWELPLQDDKYVFPWFRARPADARVGYSILIYSVE